MILMSVPRNSYSEPSYMREFGDRTVQFRMKQVLQLSDWTERGTPGTLRGHSREEAESLRCKSENLQETNSAGSTAWTQA